MEGGSEGEGSEGLGIASQFTPTYQLAELQGMGPCCPRSRRRGGTFYGHIVHHIFPLKYIFILLDYHLRDSFAAFPALSDREAVSKPGE